MSFLPAKATIREFTYGHISSRSCIDSITRDHRTHFITKVYGHVTMGCTGTIISLTFLELPAGGSMEKPFDNIGNVSAQR